MGSPRQAIRELEHGASGPRDAALLIHLYQQAGDQARARTAMQRFIEHYPRHANTPPLPPRALTARRLNALTIAPGLRLF